MIESHERTLPRIVSAPLGWVQHRWNDYWYGFSEGKTAINRMKALLNQEKVGVRDMRELIDLMVKTDNSNYQRRMAVKLRDGIDQLLESQRLPQKDMQALSDYVKRVSLEEGLE